jgi:hypothetical protein
MPRAETETYYNITEKGERLAGLYRDCGERVIFVVPSGLDKDALLDLISGGGSFFGQRPKICTWGDLYKEVSQISHARPRMITDPPDHTLIIRYILDKFLEEQDKSGNKLPDGVYRRGFSKILGDNIKELLNEDVSPRDLRDRLYMEGDPPEGSPEAILLSSKIHFIPRFARGGGQRADSGTYQGVSRGRGGRRGSFKDHPRLHRVPHLHWKSVKTYKKT